MYDQPVLLFCCPPQRDHQRKMNLSMKTAGRWMYLELHLEEATPCPGQDLVTEVATLYTPQLALWVYQEAMKDQGPTKTLNSPSSTRLLLLLLPFLKGFCSGSHGNLKFSVALKWRLCFSYIWGCCYCSTVITGDALIQLFQFKC